MYFHDETRCTTTLMSATFHPCLRSCLISYCAILSAVLITLIKIVRVPTSHFGCDRLLLMLNVNDKKNGEEENEHFEKCTLKSVL